MGKIHFYYGVMGSSKSALLIINNYNYTKDGVKTRIIKPSVDTRTNGTIKSRAMDKQVSCEVMPSIKLNDFKNDTETKVIFVDEVNFFKKPDIRVLATLADDYDKIVICYGLMVDRNEHLFTGSKALLEVGAEPHILESKCQIGTCTHRASHQVYYDEHGQAKFGGPSVLIGDAQFLSVCRPHWNQIRKEAMQQNRIVIAR
jgi:thymidine kinase